jgi:UDP-N-acetylmuramoyl-tripeptide--D-alanyl-D-alanine ligase
VRFFYVSRRKDEGKNMNLHELYTIYRKTPDISTDSRVIRPGCMFFALRGDRFNGNQFVSEALEKGAVWAVADEKEGPAGDRIIRVDDVLHTLQQLSFLHRRECRFKILAITGSNGKTTTKELCSSILLSKYKLYATQGNLNNHIGVPLTILAMPPDTELGIVEMGANHTGEIRLLCDIANPDYGLITNIGKAHLEGFGNLQGVAAAKGELFNYLADNDGTIFANAKDDNIRSILPVKSKRIIMYNNPESCWAEKTGEGMFLEVLIHDQSGRYPVKSRMVGTYNIENMVAAWTVGKYFGISPSRITKSIETYIPSNNRSQLIRTRYNEIIMDAYNANPTSMKAAIENFIAMKHCSPLIILGDMLELGESSAGEHQAVVDILKKQGMPAVICIGSHFETPAKSAGITWYPDVASLREALEASPVRDSLILIKGSRGNRLEKIADLL